jgi:hypothetical protein
MFQGVSALYLPTSARNGMKQTDPKITDLYSSGVNATGAATAWRNLLTYMVNQAYTLPVVAQQQFWMANPNVTAQQRQRLPLTPRFQPQIQPVAIHIDSLLSHLTIGS